MDLAALARRQHGVLSRIQALEAGLSPSAIRARLDSGRWQRMYPGIYLTHSGEVSWLARASAAVLHAGPGAALALTAAAHVWDLGVTDQAPQVIWVAIPWERRVIRAVGTRIRRRRALSTRTVRNLPVTTVEQTVLDLSDEPGWTSEESVALVTGACQKGKTSAEALGSELSGRKRHAHRALINVVLANVSYGIESVGEFYLLDRVVRAHGLPMPVCQAPTGDGGRRDFEWVAFGVVGEFDGRQWHDGQAFQRDRRTDRRAAREGKVTLRATWLDVTTDACDLAVDVALTLWQRGWTGSPTPCSPTCPVGRLGSLNPG